MAIVQNPDVKILILTGQPGCCKNTLLDVYCKENRIKLIRFIDQKEEHITDVFERKTFAGTKESYPDDLENLLAFIKLNIIASTQGTKVSTTKTSRFCKTPIKP